MLEVSGNVDAIEREICDERILLVCNFIALFYDWVASVRRNEIPKLYDGHLEKQNKWPYVFCLELFSKCLFAGDCWCVALK